MDMDAAILLRFIERIVVALIGGLSSYLGYRLFLRLPERREGEASSSCGTLPSCSAASGRACFSPCSARRWWVCPCIRVWPENEPGWGDPARFEAWLNEAAPEPPPAEIAAAAAYFRYGAAGAAP